jgi:hypothetical protein
MSEHRVTTLSDFLKFGPGDELTHGRSTDELALPIEL